MKQCALGTTWGQRNIFIKLISNTTLLELLPTFYDYFLIIFAIVSPKNFVPFQVCWISVGRILYIHTEAVLQSPFCRSRTYRQLNLPPLILHDILLSCIQLANLLNPLCSVKVTLLLWLRCSNIELKWNPNSDFICWHYIKLIRSLQLSPLIWWYSTHLHGILYIIL